MSKLELNPHKSVHNPDFARRNVIATEIEKVIDALKAFFSCTPPAYTKWERSVSEFQESVLRIACSLIEGSNASARPSGACRVFHQNTTR